MHPVRLAIMVVGLLLIVGGAIMLYFEAGWDHIIPIGVMTAGLVLLIGLLVVSFAAYTRLEPPAREYADERPRDRVVEVRRDAPREERTVVRE
jgi:hypothetical protein